MNGSCEEERKHEVEDVFNDSYNFVDLRPGTTAGRLPVLGISASPPCHQGVNSSGVFCYSIARLTPPLLSFLLHVIS
jgi:hypothetical protein